jgi:glycosyltransferase involved in cell wall biosynthesis
MLSVCIPVYNYDVRPTALKLLRQFETNNITGEVVILNDGSDAHTKQQLEELSSQEGINVFHQANKGRSATRNKLAQLAQYNDLIFIDSDCDVPDNFIATYSRYPCEKYPVVTGGLAYPSKPAERGKQLRWKVGVSRECQDALKRTKKLKQGFLSSNFKISKSLFNDIQFNTVLTEYGHEDTLFGIDLRKHHITITHINNPVIHLGIDHADVFLEKNHQSISNLILLSKTKDFNYISSEIKLLKKYNSLTPVTKKVIVVLFNKSQKLIKYNLLSTCPSLLLFDMYKLGYLCQLMESDKKRS